MRRTGYRLSPDRWSVTFCAQQRAGVFCAVERIRGFVREGFELFLVDGKLRAVDAKQVSHDALVHRLHDPFELSAEGACCFFANIRRQAHPVTRERAGNDRADERQSDADNQQYGRSLHPSEDTQAGDECQHQCHDDAGCDRALAPCA